MKSTTYIKFLLFVGLITLFGCSQSDETTTIDPVQTTGIKILPLGDSRVQGARPLFESYRYELWKNLVSNNWDFDFIGPIIDIASYPTFMNMNFDTDHAGVGGFQTQDILNNLSNAIASSGVPDVVLLGIGGNDLLREVSVSTAINNINQIIDILQNSNNNITIFLEQIAPGRSDIMTAERTLLFNEFNNNIATIGAQQTNANSRVIITNMATDWMDSYLADDVHYNEEGAKIIADRYYQAIDAFLERKQ
ncbi:SGNH/GDSL hydrolase family protein [Aquimarina sp. 2201CG5-10]|uniref:SGNH/GDSL hydrolase family protein n=1 Tax=Aquimarina callyspongiae TaxID=3098150 RepID=UPI002AB4F1CD|nr:GDSL-type esterase/lipase family protein [Aquimarina sp. 2201CG5-10]MDY8136233.1 GDSL-type esterase/lipase family protein [Aquimarina sp. 2201CG5-10]